MIDYDPEKTEIEKFENLEDMNEAMEEGTLWAWDDMTEVLTNLLNPEGDLREQLLDYLDDAAERFEVAAFYREYGSFRERGELTDDERDLVDRHVESRQPQSCYYNAQTAIIGVFVFEDPIKYVEGYVVSARAPGPTPHAWLEVNGRVVDITPPERDASAVYYGVAYDPQTVRDALMTREQCDPLAEEVETYPPLDAE